MSDETKTELGPLCKRGHDRDGSGQSLRYKSTRQCVDCMSERRAGYGKAYYEQNADRIRRKARCGYHEKREKRLNQMAAYRKTEAFRRSKKRHHERYRPEILERRKQWRAANKDAVSGANRKHAQTYPGKMRERGIAYSRSEGGKAVRQAINARRRARKKAANSQAYGAREVGERFQRFGWNCAYCGSTGKQSIDHFRSLAAGGQDIPSNIVPACRSCNSSKGKAEPEIWYAKHPRRTDARWRLLLDSCDEGQRVE